MHWEIVLALLPAISVVVAAALLDNG